MSEIKTNKLSPRKGTTQTIGDSGDTVSIACGVTVTNVGNISTVGISGGTIDNQGTITGLQGVINWDTTAKTTNFNASSQTGYFVNTTSGAITVTFPASPTAGDVIALKDYANTFDTNNLTIDPNGNNIQGAANNFIVSVEGTSAQFIYVDATRGWVLTDASKASDIAEGPSFITATGGCISYCGDFKIHTFTGPGTFCVSSLGNPIGGPNNADYLVVAGGGAGGVNKSGGGGAGGFRTTYPTCGGSLPISVTSYPITVGGGGAATPTKGGSGSNSVFSTITSAGGGGGGSYNTCYPDPSTRNGISGGSGGGGAGSENVFSPPNTGTGGTGNTPPTSPPQGTTGGNGAAITPGSAAAGGGGGSSGVGSNGSPSGGGAGGSGTPNSITGSSVTYAGGGGGGTRSLPGGAGGSGGGGVGGWGCTGEQGGPGIVNTGGGGGGSGQSGNVSSAGTGGSGIVIIRYKYQ